MMTNAERDALLLKMSNKLFDGLDNRMERVEKELLLCEVCGEVLAPADQLRWLAERLGAASFANPTLTMFAGRSLGYVEQGVRSQSDRALRADRMALQCPRCKRKTARAA